MVVLVFAEAAVFVGFVLPRETAAILGGILASTGRLPLPLVVLSVAAAAVVGDSVGYEVGRRYGARVLAWRPLRPHRSRVAAAQRTLRERGGWAVVLGRFTAFARAVMPGLAGASGMPYRRFLVYNVVGAVIWGVGATLVGFLAGHSYVAAERALGRGSAAAAAAVVLVAVVGWHWRRRRRRARPATTTADRGEQYQAPAQLSELSAAMAHPALTTPAAGSGDLTGLDHPTVERTNP